MLPSILPSTEIPSYSWFLHQFLSCFSTASTKCTRIKSLTINEWFKPIYFAHPRPALFLLLGSVEAKFNVSFGRLSFPIAAVTRVGR